MVAANPTEGTVCLVVGDRRDATYGRDWPCLLPEALMFSVEQVRDWLRGSENELLSGQDSDMLLASYLSAAHLTLLYQEGGALTDRRDVIALAIVNRLDWLQDEDEWDAPQQPGEGPEKEIASLRSFVRSHLDEFKAADERIGFGVQFGRIVLPWVTRRNGDAG